jgi:hypothetical protein
MVYGQPKPTLIFFGSHKAPHFVKFSLAHRIIWYDVALYAANVHVLPYVFEIDWT